MKASGRVIAALLALAVVLVLPGVHGFALTASQPVHPAGCHGHSPAKPASTSFLCCASNHHAATVIGVFSVPALAVYGQQAGSEFATAFESDSSLNIHSANRPPGAAILRI